MDNYPMKNFHIQTAVMDAVSTVFRVWVNKDKRCVEFRGPDYQSWTGDQSTPAERLHDSLEGWHACVLHTESMLTVMPGHPDYEAVKALWETS